MSEIASMSSRGAAGEQSRARELAAIVAQFEVACGSGPAGGARAVLVSGDPGIGKSWVVRQAAALLAARGALVLEGYALDLHGMPPLFPLGRAFGATLRDDPLLADRVEARFVLAAAGVGHLPAGAPDPPRLGPEAAALRVFDAFAEVCRCLAAARPLVLTLDDMQWAAAPTWDTLHYLLRTLRDAPVLVLLAGREELIREPGGTAARTVAELVRQRTLTQFQLLPLDPSETARLASKWLGGHEVAPELVDRLVRRSEGNPFFIEEMLQDLRQRGLLTRRGGVWRLAPHAPDVSPATLQLAIGLRLDRLPATCEEPLAAGAVLGREFAARTVAAAVGCPPEDLRARLEPAEVAGLIDVTSGGWRFRHDTVREALLDRHASEAELLHAAAARAIAQSAGYAPGVDTLLALAEHWERADIPEKAGPAAIAAARAAISIHALPQALAYARKARLLCERAADRLPPGPLHESAQLLGDIAMAAGAYGEAAEAHRVAADLARASCETVAEGRAWLRRGEALRRQERPVEAGACYHEALERLDDHTHAADVAEVLIALCDLEGLTRARYAAAREAGERALTLADRLADRGLKARSTLALANVESRAAGPEAALALLEGALEHALAAGDLILAAEVCGSLANACYWLGEIGRSRAHAEERLRIARRIADPFARRHAHSWLALLAATRGDWDEAARLLEESERSLVGLDSPEPVAFLQVVHGFIAVRQGRFGDARDRLQDALATFTQLGDETVLWYAGLLALASVEDGRLDEARALAADQERRLASLDPSALPARSARCALGLVYAALGDREAGARCEDALLPYALDFHWSPARRTLAALAALRGDTEAADAHLAAAELRLRAEKLLPDLGLVLLDRAALMPPQARRPLLDEARAILVRFEMRAELARLQQLARAVPRAAALHGLSAREVEVLRLLAGGMTNRDIATHLVISERTVANHLAHIYGKIEVDNRAAAAAFAFRNGLA
ncbi:MAG: AAA family ATPase [Dehalococcoidia bacterium]